MAVSKSSAGEALAAVSHSIEMDPSCRPKVTGEDGIGWHNFRHTFSSMLRELKTDVKVQQELLRHADVRTTLQIYTQAPDKQKREAVGKLFRMVLPRRA